MEIKQQMILNFLSKSNIINEFKSDPKKAYLRVIGNLITGMKKQGYDNDLKKYLKENHGWLFK